MGQIQSPFDPTAHAYEPAERARVGPELLAIVRSVLPATWQLLRRAIWYECSSPTARPPAQGWKIHVSATIHNCAEILERTAAVCVAADVPFKFAVDTAMVRLINSKHYPRAASGKFITIYPGDGTFKDLAAALSRELAGYCGPYILSDRRYGQSGVVYYRYGAFVDDGGVSPSGETLTTIRTPEGHVVPDQREPRFTPPPWVDEPVPAPKSDRRDHRLRGDRYLVRSALAFSNTGGVYSAEDTFTGTLVVIKEARPHVEVDPFGRDAVRRLEAEYETLGVLGSADVAPRALDFFREWEHAFLVMEHVEGIPLSRFMTSNHPLLKIRPEQRHFDEYAELLLELWVALADSLAAVHALGFVMSDVSHTNVIIHRDPMHVSFIDFEGSFRDSEPPSGVFTPSFASREQMRHGSLSAADDCYSLGAIYLSTLFPVTGLLSLDRDAAVRFFDETVRDLRLPGVFREVPLSLVAERADRRPTAMEVAKALRGEGLAVRSSDRGQPPAPQHSDDRLSELVEGLTAGIVASMDLRRGDRLFPADEALYQTNPVSVAYGACGVARALQWLDVPVSPEVHTWLLENTTLRRRLPAGLYSGLAGVAWALDELGHRALAEKLMEEANAAATALPDSSVYQGIAGVGLANLYFFQRTGDHAYLELAARDAETLIERAVVTADGWCWPPLEGTVRIGYPYGSSGIALFLLYVWCATADERCRSAAGAALQFDLSTAQTVDGALTFPFDATRDDPRVYPYWERGSAGIGTALLRYAALTRSDDHLGVLQKLIPDVCRQYTVFPSLFRGLAGLGNFLLDLHRWTADERWRDEAQAVAAGVERFVVRGPWGVGIAGQTLLHISCDFATGAAGVALFLHRLLHGGPNFNLLLDEELLPQGGAGLLKGWHPLAI